MRDPDVTEAQHQEDAILVGAGLARDERRIAVEPDAGERDRGLVLRRGYPGVYFPRQRRLDRCGCEGERGDAAHRAGSAEAEIRSLPLRTGQDVDPPRGGTRVAGALHYA